MPRTSTTSSLVPLDPLKAAYTESLKKNHPEAWCTALITLAKNIQNVLSGTSEAQLAQEAVYQRAMELARDQHASLYERMLERQEEGKSWGTPEVNRAQAIACTLLKLGAVRFASYTLALHTDAWSPKFLSPLFSSIQPGDGLHMERTLLNRLLLTGTVHKNALPSSTSLLDPEPIGGELFYAVWRAVDLPSTQGEIATGIAPLMSDMEYLGSDALCALMDTAKAKKVNLYEFLISPQVILMGTARRTDALANFTAQCQLEDAALSPTTGSIDDKKPVLGQGALGTQKPAERGQLGGHLSPFFNRVQEEYARRHGTGQRPYAPTTPQPQKSHPIPSAEKECSQSAMGQFLEHMYRTFATRRPDEYWKTLTGEAFGQSSLLYGYTKPITGSALLESPGMCLATSFWTQLPEAADKKSPSILTPLITPGQRRQNSDVLYIQQKMGIAQNVADGLMCLAPLTPLKNIPDERDLTGDADGKLQNAILIGQAQKALMSMEAIAGVPVSNAQLLIFSSPAALALHSQEDFRVALFDPQLIEVKIVLWEPVLAQLMSKMGLNPSTLTSIKDAGLLEPLDVHALQSPTNITWSKVMPLPHQEPQMIPDTRTKAADAHTIGTIDARDAPMHYAQLNLCSQAAYKLSDGHFKKFWSFVLGAKEGSGALAARTQKLYEGFLHELPLTILLNRLLANEEKTSLLESLYLKHVLTSEPQKKNTTSQSPSLGMRGAKSDSTGTRRI